MMTREEAIPIIKARDGKLDPLCVRDFCDFCGYKMCIRDSAQLAQPFQLDAFDKVGVFDVKTGDQSYFFQHK